MIKKLFTGTLKRLAWKYSMQWKLEESIFKLWQKDRLHYLKLGDGLLESFICGFILLITLFCLLQTIFLLLQIPTSIVQAVHHRKIINKSKTVLISVYFVVVKCENSVVRFKRNVFMPTSILMIDAEVWENRELPEAHALWVQAFFCSIFH